MVVSDVIVFMGFKAVLLCKPLPKINSVWPCDDR